MLERLEIALEHYLLAHAAPLVTHLRDQYADGTAEAFKLDLMVRQHQLFARVAEYLEQHPTSTLNDLLTP